MDFETPTTMRDRFIFLGGRRGNDKGGKEKGSLAINRKLLDYSCYPSRKRTRRRTK